MIDLKARAALRASRANKALVDSVKNVASTPVEDPLMNAPFKEVLRLASRKDGEKAIADQLGKIGSALVMVYNIVKKPIVLPRIFQVEGKVEVTRPITVRNLQELGGYFKSLEDKLSTWAQAASTAPAPIIQVPKIELPKMSKGDNAKVEGLLQDLVEKIDNFKPQEVKFPKHIEVSNFPITHTAQPVTNFSINALQGFAKSTAVTVGTTLTKLPSYGQLNNRRSLILYNNGLNTVYVGGSDVTSSTGLPIPAATYSPPIDAGVYMIIYGVTSSSTSDVRVLEVSSNQTASIVQ